MASKTTSRRLLFIPLALGLLFGALSFLPQWISLDRSIYDLFLRMSPAIPEDHSLVLLNIDDEAITRAGTWPWPRGLFAQGLEALTEFNAAAAVFDIEYLNKSPMSVDQGYLDNNLHTRFSEDFQEIKSSVYDLLNAVSQGSIRKKDIAGYTSDLTDRVGQIETGLYSDTRRVAVENDSYLGKAMRLFGHSFVTLNTISAVEHTTPESLRQLAEERFSYPNVTGLQNTWSGNKDFLIPIPEIASMAAGAGFTNVTIDPDGSRRRIRLVQNIQGRLYLQLAFGPLVKRLGDPQIEVQSGAVILKGATLGGQKLDIRIPINSQGEMLIHWPKKKFDNSFAPHISFYRLLEYRQTEADLAQALSSLEQKAVWDLVPGKNPVRSLLVSWKACETARNKALESGTEEDRQAWVLGQETYYGLLGSFTASSVDAEALGYLQTAKAQDTPANATLYDQLQASFEKAFSDIRSEVKTLVDSRTSLRQRLQGSTCLIGLTAIASTDFGVNPFDEKYANVGTHAALTNTIVQRQFLSEAPIWLSSLLALGLALGLVVLIQRMKTGAQILVGVSSTVGLFAVFLAVFVVFGIYIAALAPLLSVFLSFLFFTLAVFFFTEQEKSFLRKAFSTYLSSDVIEQIVLDPASLKLGGQKRWISAMFTDVKGFSTVSEKLEPEDLVRLLNLYLSSMSDIILENRGTIDKFEGDAIISFFGAPVAYNTHAHAICRAALLMKRKEDEMNVRFLTDGLSPTPLLTRIGINTGDMVVGNMGTERKMDYTIMGNAVNLAARLEGVNKQYGTWILATEPTYHEAGGDFVWRRLDRVRVVGINQPQRLFELVDFSEELPPQKSVLLKSFDQALDVFEAREWAEATKAFGALARDFPDDGPSRVYLKRSRDFLESPPSAEWEGVFNLTEK